VEETVGMFCLAKIPGRALQSCVMLQVPADNIHGTNREAGRLSASSICTLYSRLWRLGRPEAEPVLAIPSCSGSETSY
jgi:hypothetical protein